MKFLRVALLTTCVPLALLTWYPVLQLPAADGKLFDIVLPANGDPGGHEAPLVSGLAHGRVQGREAPTGPSWGDAQSLWFGGFIT